MKNFSIIGWENEHNRRTESIERLINSIFQSSAKEAIEIARTLNIDPSKPFSFKNYPQSKALIDKWYAKLSSKLKAKIDEATETQWAFANAKNDAFIAAVLEGIDLPKRLQIQYNQRNKESLRAFQARKDAGLNLSDRVFKYTNQFKAEIEMAIDVGLDGRSAQKLSQDVREYLQEPDKLFRRVRDKYGNLKLSRHAKAYHPGAGVYRSSAKNAIRLARTEINMAYRTADHLRYQQLDFIVGFEVKRSNRHYDCKLCDALKGKYPKTFLFRSWHSNCRCYVVSILASQAEMDARFEAELINEEYYLSNSKNAINEPHSGWNDWIRDNEEKIKTAKTPPYFIKDNAKFVDKISPK